MSDNHQELVVVKNVAIFEKNTSFSVVFVFMPFRHEPDAQCAPLRSGERSCAINSDLPNSLSFDTVGNGLCNLPQGIEIRRWISEEMSRKISYVPDIFTCIEWYGSRNGT